MLKTFICYYFNFFKLSKSMGIELVVSKENSSLKDRDLLLFKDSALKIKARG